MPMVVKNNMPAKKTLNTLNKNAKALKKSLAKVSSGMKINSAADDASGYAISERMRVQVRSLAQANDNTQNTASLMKTAEGAVSSTVEILKTMKQKAINAANDTNTDADRAIIQKELDQAIDQVEDNANVTFNGKWLLNGVQQVIDDPKTAIVAALHTEWIENALNLIEETYGLGFEDPQAYNTKMTLHFNGAGDDPVPTTPQDMTNVPLWVNNLYDGDSGDNRKLELHINMNFFKNMEMQEDSVDGSFVDSASNEYKSDELIARHLVLAVMDANIHLSKDLPSYITSGAAAALVGHDGYLKNPFPTDLSALASSAENFGYVYFRYLANHGAGEPTDVTKLYMRALNENYSTVAGALDGAVKLATQGKFQTNADMLTQMTDDYNTAGNMRDFLARYCGINLDNDDTGALTGKDAGYKVDKTAHGVIPEGGSTRFWYLPTSESSFINGLEIVWGNGFKRPDKAYTFQVGTKANQSIKVSFEDLSARGLGLMAADGTKVSVATQHDAKQAITLFDQAVRKALDMQTTIGSVQSRLEYTSSNLVTASENTQGAESTIRDADMAKEMTEYTKSNVLLQSAQSMLAQANQNSSSVLSLLQ